jgi:hypothetical protein
MISFPGSAGSAQSLVRVAAPLKRDGMHETDVSCIRRASCGVCRAAACCARTPPCAEYGGSDEGQGHHSRDNMHSNMCNDLQDASVSAPGRAVNAIDAGLASAERVVIVALGKGAAFHGLQLRPQAVEQRPASSRDPFFSST